MPTESNSDRNYVVNELIDDCLFRISQGDPNAAFDLAQVSINHVDEDTIKIFLALIEGLTRQSSKLGSDAAKEFLEEQWSSMKTILEIRYKRRGLA